MKKVLFWDIDGTLLTTNRAGVAAFDEACREIMEIEVFDWTGLDIRGATDRGIARRALDAHGKPSDDAAIDRLLRCYESRLPARLAERQGQPLPNVVAILEHLKSRTDVVSMLLTGNTRRGAREKLGYCGLLDYFHGPNGDGAPFGAFADDGVLRDHIARAAFVLAEKVAGAGVSGDRCFVIGDTPHDISCGKAIGARTVAVATGGHPAPELHACAPWLLWEELPEPAAFERALGLS
jgi:phosphoglycolate phosphatase-like HAD superfamily hydrolase